MPTLLEQLKRSPRLPDYLREIEAVMKEEQGKREAFYEQIAEDKKMEFINGEIIFHSPVKLRHNVAGKLLLTLLDTFVSSRENGFVGYEKMLISLTRNDYEPDICYWQTAKASQFTDDQMQFPAPDLIVEILSPSTEADDRGVKFEDYAAHGVTEYWIVDPEKQSVEQYLLEGDTYQLKHQAAGVEILFCQVIAGFHVPVNTIFDRKENLEFLQKMLAQ